MALSKRLASASSALAVMGVTNIAIKDSAATDRLCAEGFPSMRGVVISVRLLVPKFPAE
jgi:hypothetical protein